MKSKNQIFAVGFTIIFCFLLGFISIYNFSEYGWTVFVIIPIFIGFLPPFLASNLEEIKVKEAYQLSFSTLGLSLLALLIFALEGMICIVMSLPILAILTWLGTFICIQVNKNIKPNTPLIVIGIAILSISSMSFDVINKPEGLIPVRTKIEINATIDSVWQNVVSFNKIEEPKDWIFKTGVSCPIDATIEGKGVGAIRYCNFTTGSFVEPITTWDEPNLLQFDVVEQPTPMNEYNPFWDIHPPHLDGYFMSYKGQFQLTKTDCNTTILEGTTWYKVDITPEFYWKTWSDFIIHRIHKRVLNHIKNESEKI